jgi:hypothetical protein
MIYGRKLNSKGIKIPAIYNKMYHIVFLYPPILIKMYERRCPQEVFIGGEGNPHPNPQK